MHVTTQSLGLWRYASGVHGFCSMAEGMPAVGKSTNQLIGSEGRIETDLANHSFSMRTYDGSA